MIQLSIENSENFKLTKDYVQSLDRGLQILQVFAQQNTSLSVSEMANLTKLSRPTVRRLLLTLEYLGYVISEQNTFSLAPKILTLSNAYLLSQKNSWKLAIPYMQQFADETGESCSIAVLDYEKIIYVARVSKKRIMSINIEVGTNMPAVATSMGHVLLSYKPESELREFLNQVKLEKYTEYTILDKEELFENLKNTQKRGWAGVDQQFEIGLRSIAVPIFDKRGHVVAALNCSAHAGRVSKDELSREILPLLQRTSEKITETIFV